MAWLKHTQAKLRFRVLGCLITVLIGLPLLPLPDTALQRLSFDLPFRLRPEREAMNAVIVTPICTHTLTQRPIVVLPEPDSPVITTGRRSVPVTYWVNRDASAARPTCNRARSSAKLS